MKKNITEDFPYTIIYSTAFNENNPEFKKARELGLKMMSYNEALGKLIKITVQLQLLVRTEKPQLLQCYQMYLVKQLVLVI